MQTNDILLLVVGFILAYLGIEKLRGIISKFTRLCDAMDENIENDSKRMQLLNDALIKLAQESAGINSAASRVEKLVSAASTAEQDPMAQYNVIVRDLMDQGYDQTEANRIATQQYNDQMLGQF